MNGKWYKVNVNFGGYIGCDEEYEVFAANDGEAIEEALELAKEELSAEIIEDEEDEEYEC